MTALFRTSLVTAMMATASLNAQMQTGGFYFRVTPHAFGAAVSEVGHPDPSTLPVSGEQPPEDTGATPPISTLPVSGEEPTDTGATPGMVTH